VRVSWVTCSISRSTMANAAQPQESSWRLVILMPRLRNGVDLLIWVRVERDAVWRIWRQRQAG
jgi:hypothetical protein